MSETDLSAAIRDALERLPVIVIRQQSGRVQVRGGWMYLAPNGTPDIQVVTCGGRSVWLESKTPDGKLRPDQTKMHAQLKMLGHVVCVVRTPQQAVDAVIAAIKEGGRG